MKNCKTFLSIIFTLLVIMVVAKNNDTRLRTGAKLSYEISDFKFAAETEYRIKDNFNRTDKILLDFDIVYKISKHVNIFTSYRYITKYKKDNSTVSRNRFGIGFGLKYKYKKFKTSLKTKYLNYFEFPNYIFDDTKHLRLKPELSYNFSKLNITPYIFSELFYRLGMEKKFDFNNIRYALGLKYKINKKQNIDIYIMLDKDLDKLDKRYILGISYTLKFKHEK